MKGHSEHNSSEKEQQNQEIPGMNLDNKYKAKMPSVEASQEIQKEMDKTRKELEKLKSFIIKKYPFTQALSILPAPAMKFFIEEEEVPKEAEKYIQLYWLVPEDQFKKLLPLAVSNHSVPSGSLLNWGEDNVPGTQYLLN